MLKTKQLGLRSLLNSFGFYALAHTYRAQKPYGFQVHTFYVVVVIGLSFISERLMATSFRVFALELSALVCCHIACFYIAYQDRLDLESRHRESSAFGGWIWAAYAAQLVTVAIAHFRFGWNAGKSQPTRGGSITEELLRERSGLQRQDSTMSAFSFTSDEWSMAPEVVSTFQSGHVEDISNENVLNERWRRLSFVRVYMRKFCLFGGWAVIFVWGVVTLYQSARVLYPEVAHSARRLDVEELHLPTIDENERPVEAREVDARQTPPAAPVDF